MTAEEILDALENPGDFTARLRENLRMSQRDFAEHVGVSRSVIRHIEKGRSRGSRDVIIKILRAAEKRREVA